VLRGPHKSLERRKPAVEKHLQIAKLGRFKIHRGPVPRQLADLGDMLLSCQELDEV